MLWSYHPGSAVCTLQNEYAEASQYLSHCSVHTEQQMVAVRHTAAVTSNHHKLTSQASRKPNPTVPDLTLVAGFRLGCRA